MAVKSVPSHELEMTAKQSDIVNIHSIESDLGGPWAPAIGKSTVHCLLYDH